MDELRVVVECINNLLDEGYLAIDDRGELVDSLSRFRIDDLGRLILESPERVITVYYDPECEWIREDDVLYRLRQWRFVISSALRTLDELLDRGGYTHE